MYINIYAQRECKTEHHIEKGFGFSENHRHLYNKVNF